MHCKECKNGTLKECKVVEKPSGTHFYGKSKLLTVENLSPNEIMVFCPNCNHYEVMKEKTFYNPKKPITHKIGHSEIYAC
jgi:hypothetical protein